MEHLLIMLLVDMVEQDIMVDMVEVAVLLLFFIVVHKLSLVLLEVVAVVQTVKKVVMMPLVQDKLVVHILAVQVYTLAFNHLHLEP